MPRKQIVLSYMNFHSSWTEEPKFLCPKASCGGSHTEHWWRCSQEFMKRILQGWVVEQGKTICQFINLLLWWSPSFRSQKWFDFRVIFWKHWFIQIESLYSYSLGKLSPKFISKTPTKYMFWTNNICFVTFYYSLKDTRMAMLAYEACTKTKDKIKSRKKKSSKEEGYWREEGKRKPKP